MSHRKPASRRQGRGTADLQPVTSLPVRVPDPPGRVRESTVERWDEFWRSKIARQVEESDHEALRRLFRLYDEIERLWDGIEDMGRVVEGSQGQPRPNPLFKQVESFQAEARQLEDRFGLSPKARLQLGITFVEAQRGLDELNDRLAAKVAAQDDPFAESS